MKTTVKLFIAARLVLSAGSALAAVRYVDVNSTNATPPYANWTTAATNIQDAVDAAVAGDEIVVTNGIYATGGRAINFGDVNRVAVDKPLNLRSMNGPQSTIIDGGHSGHCVYLTNGASLSGFTLTHGYAVYAAGLLCESTNVVVSNCVMTGNWAYGTPGVGYGAGGGVYFGTLNNCTLTGNWASGDLSGGGGAYCSTLNNCTLTGNRAGYFGGGAYSSTLNNCTLSGNSASYGGGASYSTLNNCTLTGNSDGGARNSTLNNCTLTGNSGGASYQCTLNNCIAYFNTADGGVNYDSSCVLNYCRTTPQPTNGVGNITNAPLFVNPALGDYRLRADSPCIDAGTNLSASITNDLDGRPRPLDGNGDGLAAFDMGAYEYRTPLLVWEDSPNPAPPHADWATAAHTIQEAVDDAFAGDEVVVTNGTYATGGRTIDGVTTNRVAVDKPLTLRSVNGPQVTMINGGQSNRCVYLANGASLSGFTLTNGWSTWFDGGGVFCDSVTATVANCVLSHNLAGYGGGAYGGTLNNCALTGNSAGDGGGAYSSRLNNCTLTGNQAAISGGGAHGCTMKNCTLMDNRAGGVGGNFACGGGAFSGTLDNCALTGNFASSSQDAYGGGTYQGTLNNCTLVSNSVSGNFFWSDGAGAYASTLNHCIVYFNQRENYLNYDSSTTLNYSCTTPQPTNGVGNITNAPLFLDQASGNLRLQSNSPCINAGRNAFAPAGPDLDGNPRIVGGTVDIGAYEFQSLDLVSFGVVANQFGFNITGQSNWVIVLETCSDFTKWTPLATNSLSGSAFPFRDPTPPNLPQRFYRARLE